jgi:DNA-binding transcriptional regulator GbsR (MarR family)
MTALSPMVEAFILHFGEMGSRWGINRTVGQMYALLVMSEEPLNAEAISDALGVSRSNVSMGLKELNSWRLIRSHQRLGDRREYYSAPDDFWEIARTLIEERRKREIDPTLSMLRHLLLEEAHDEGERYAQSRMGDMLELMELVTRWSEEMQRLSTPELKQLLKLGSGVSRVLDLRDRLGGRKPKAS